MAINRKYSRYYSRRRDLAIQGEQSAADYLIGLGYEIIARNWHSGRWGEIDIIACDPKGTMIFVEVKTRSIAPDTINGIYPVGFEAINLDKQKKIIRSAWRFQKIYTIWTSVRFDAVVVIYRVAACYDQRKSSSEPEIIHVPNAFAPS